MERLRAALLGCLLTGGVLVGPRPLEPRAGAAWPVARVSGIGRDRAPDAFRRWLQPVTAALSLDVLQAQAGLLGSDAPEPLLPLWQDALSSGHEHRTPARGSRPVPRCLVRRRTAVLRSEPDAG